MLTNLTLPPRRAGLFRLKPEGSRQPHHRKPSDSLSEGRA